jgi:uncharacterized membrane protein
MIESTDRVDRLVEDYLGAVSYACGDLPPERRDDLLADLREHITAARSVLYEPTEAGVRTVLDRLGEPSAIAEEARLAEGLAANTPKAPRARPVSEDVEPGPCFGLLARPLPPAAFVTLCVVAMIVIFLLGAIMIASR